MKVWSIPARIRSESYLERNNGSSRISWAACIAWNLALNSCSFPGFRSGWYLSAKTPRRLALACVTALERDAHHRTKLPILFLDLGRICCRCAFQVPIVIVTEIRFDHFDQCQVGPTMNSILRWSWGNDYFVCINTWFTPRQADSEWSKLKMEGPVRRWVERSVLFPAVQSLADSSCRGWHKEKITISVRGKHLKFVFWPPLVQPRPCDAPNQ